MSHAYLMLCHQAPRHLLTWATRQPEARFYVHYDAKSALDDLAFLRSLANVVILPHRLPIFWGGFNMVAATLNLFQAALMQPENRFFHLISGDCVPLKSTDELDNCFAKLPENALLMESVHTPRLRYRTRFDAPHANTVWQRSLLGKIITKTLQLSDKLLPSKAQCLSGSQWFSATRPAMQVLLSSHNLDEACQHFAKKLCPDEHFFQYLAAKQPEKIQLIHNNQRFIRFQAGNNHPDLLSLDELWQAQEQDFWFARKASPEILAQFFAGQQGA